MSDERLPPAWLKPHGSRWTHGEPRRIHDNPWFGLDVYDAVAPTGAPATYYIHDQKPVAVGALPLHDDGTVTLVGQWRFPFDAYSWEIPEGGSPREEDPLDGAKRELGEEAGLKARDWRHVLTLQLSNASSNEYALCYLATWLEPTSGHHLDDTEALAIERVPFGEALAAAGAGQIQDAITVAMLLRVHHMAVVGALDPALAQAVLMSVKGNGG